MIDIGLSHYLTLGAMIFTIGVVGIFLNRKNIIVILMSIELFLLAVNINLVSFSIFLDDLMVKRNEETVDRPQRTKTKGVFVLEVRQLCVCS